MTKEELKEEAAEYYEDETEGTFQICEDCYWFADAVQTAYVDSAEPREKQIAELKKQLGNLYEIIKRPYQFTVSKKIQMVKEAEQFLK